jgi:hypothetical protein
MTNPPRLEFLARHFGDLQMIRFAPLPAAMMLAVFAPPVSHLSRSVAWAMLLGFLALLVGVYRWSTLAIRRRYGSVTRSAQDAQRIERHPLIVALNIMAAVLMGYCYFSPHSYFFDVYIAFTILVLMLRIILDPTNLPIRRTSWMIGLLVLFSAGPFLLHVSGAAVALIGAVWLSLSIFDFLLLRRTFAQRTGALPGAAAEAVLHGG